MLVFIRKSLIRMFFVFFAAIFIFVNTSYALNFSSDSLVGNTFSFSEGDRSASAEFSYSGDIVEVTLTNTFGGDVLNPVHLLQAVFFDITGDVTFTPVSALLNTGSVVLFDNDPPDGSDGIVSGEFAYSNLSGNPLLGSRGSQGISGVGYDLFAPTDVFGGPNLDGPVEPNGMQYGILSAGYDPLTSDGNKPVTGHMPLIQNSVVFALSGASGLGIGDVSSVSFEYGTDLEAVPEPSTVLLLGAGIFGLGLYERRRRKK